MNVVAAMVFAISTRVTLLNVRSGMKMSSYCDHKYCRRMLQYVIENNAPKDSMWGVHITCKYADIIHYAIQKYPSEFAYHVAAPAIYDAMRSRE